MKRLRVSLGVSLCVSFFIGSGCAKRVQTMIPVLPFATSTLATMPPAAELVWERKGEGIERASVEFSTSTASTIVLYRFSLSDHLFSFRQAITSRTVSEWAKQLPEAVFVANGVYFHEDQLPSGWLKTAKQVVGSRSFDLDKSALLTLQPVVSIETASEKQIAVQRTSTEAAQSYPMLVQQGKPMVKTNSGKISRRTFVGLDRTHQYLYIGIVPYTSISLYELGLTLSQLPIYWEAVLNLDGGPSSGVQLQTRDGFELIDSYVTVPNVLIVTPHP
jgi:hypothetical protein